MILTRTRAAYADCAEHLHATASLGSPIESYLTQHLLVLLCAEVQSKLYDVVEERSKLLADRSAQNYINDSVRRILRSVRKSDIANLLGMFDVRCRNALNETVDDTEVTMYNNAVGTRHDIAHRVGTQVSFREFPDAMHCAERLLAAFEQAIKV